VNATMTTLERDFADALVKTTGHEPRRVGNEWKTLCPGHGDTAPSLDFREADGIIVATCRSRGCSWESIRAALDWKPKTAGDTFAKRPVRARYTYTDEKGRELVQKIRFDDDREPKCTFSKKLNGEKLPLYRLSDVLSAVRDGRPVYVTEGERDADTLHSLGLCGTSAPYGAVTGTNVSGKWLDAYTAALAGADVVLLQDADAAGVDNVRNVARLLAGRVKSLRVVPPFPGPKGTDISDYLAAHGREATLSHVEKEEEHACAAPETVARPVLVRLSDVRPERVSWLWPGRVPFGKLTLLEGDPGLGKSTLALDIIACATTGRPMPNGAQGAEPASAVILSAEDGLADTIRPRLKAAEADLSRVHALTAVKMPDGAEVFPTLTANLEQIREAVVKTAARIVLVDPLAAYIGSETNSWKDTDIRRCLAPLAALAEDLRVAIVLIRHLTKSGGAAAIYRGGGSIGIVAACRSALLVAKDPEDEDRRILAPVKSNLCAPPPSLAYRMESRGDVARIAWEPGIVEMTAGELLAAQGGDDEDADGPSMVEEAAEFLRDLLQHGAVGTIAVQKSAREAGHSWRTVRRAQKRLGIRPEKTPEGWRWKLSETGQGGQGVQGVHIYRHGHLDHYKDARNAENTLPERPEPVSGSAVQGGQGSEAPARHRERLGL
jgi:putative DNA primase/helicase